MPINKKELTKEIQKGTHKRNAGKSHAVQIGR